MPLIIFKKKSKKLKLIETTNHSCFSLQYDLHITYLELYLSIYLLSEENAHFRMKKLKEKKKYIFHIRTIK